MTRPSASTVALFGLLLLAASGGPLRSAGPDPLQGQAALVAGELGERAGSRIPPELRPELAWTIVSEARVRGLEPALVLAVIEVESSFRPDAVSTARAYGLMQIRRRTGAHWAQRLGIPWQGEDGTLLDPIANVRIGIAYLARLRDRFESLPTALAAYNHGPTSVSRKLVRGEAVPAHYTRRVMEAWEQGDQGTPG
jgi:soluble lytic murein transglycosylase